MCKYIRFFEELSAKDIKLAGGKGASLGELTLLNMPVPRGFVILTSAWEWFLAEGEKTRLPIALQKLIVQAFRNLGVSRVSVRSSATAEDSETSAWAGQLETILNVDEKGLFEAILQCYSSLFSKRALAYSIEHGYRIESIQLALVVQAMLDPEAAGVGFTVHPLTQEEKIMFLQSSFGLGEAVVSGAVNPDTWIIEKDSCSVLEYSISKKKKALYINEEKQTIWKNLGKDSVKPSLSIEQVEQYASYMRMLEEHYGQAMDTEWALEKGEFYLLQARPITTLSPDYKNDVFDCSIPWIPWIRRPWNLFSASLYYMNLLETSRIYSLYTTSVLLIEWQTDMAEVFFNQGFIADLFKAVEQVLKESPDTILAHLEKALEMVALVDCWKQTQELTFTTIEDLISSMKEIVTATVHLPYILVDQLNNRSLSRKEDEIFKLSTELRSTSTYPWFEKCIKPLLKKRFEEWGLLEIEDPMRVCTVDEVLNKNIPSEVFLEREYQVRKGQMYLFQGVGSKVDVKLLEQTAYLIFRLKKARLPRVFNEEKTLTGVAVYPGCVEGVARIIFHPEDQERVFNEGDILITINSNPCFMPLIVKASALVSEEGGAACHAAIISRELKKPCLMGVEDVTERVKDGQRIRVDTFEQTLTLL